MKKFIQSLRSVAKKRFVPIIALFAAAAIPVAIVAWGPGRSTFTVENPATYNTFNSITNNPHVGDERNFVVIKDAANTADGGWQDKVEAVPGKEYLVRIYVHNNANANLNLTATNTRVTVGLPTNTGKDLNFTGYVSADNAQPGKVYDDAGLTSANDFNIAYVPGSAEIYNNATGPGGRKLSDSIVQPGGAQVGYEANDGNVPGCFQYASYVYFKVKVQGPQTSTFDMQKTVRKKGDAAWQEKVDAKAGETVQYRIKYSNTGQVQQDNVTVKDTLPNGVSYVPGTTMVYNTATPNGFKASDNVTTGGINIGSYAPGSTAYVMFDAKIAENDKLPVCGPNTLRNVASVTTDYGSKDDDANVVVPKECQPPKAKYECSGLTVNKISRTQFSFKATSTIENADFVKYTYVVKDASGKEIKRIDGNQTAAVTYENATAGKYTVTAYLTVKVNGSDQTVTSQACAKPFEVVEQPVTNKYVCESLQVVKRIDRDSFEFKVTPQTAGNVSVKEYVFDFGDTTTKTVGAGQETQRHDYAKPGEYTVKVSVTFMVDGKTVAGVTSQECQTKVTVEQPPVDECKPGIPTGDARCEDTTNPCVDNPNTPDVDESQNPECVSMPGTIPSTGAGSLIAGLVSVSSLAFGATAWLNSRRALKGMQ